MADFQVPNGVNYAWVRGVTPGSAYAQWESFASIGGPNNPDVGQSVVGTLAPGAQPFNVTAAGTLTVIAGSGNLYSGFAPTSVAITAPGFNWPAGTTTLLVQVRTVGTEINGVTVNIGGVAPTSVTELSRIGMGAQGAQVETLYRFDLPSDVSTYTLLFSSLTSHFSLDRVAIDTFTVPAPGAAALLGLVGLGVSRRRRA
jgi:MYXO-CTERM domain-containing protein